MLFNIATVRAPREVMHVIFWAADRDMNGQRDFSRKICAPAMYCGYKERLPRPSVSMVHFEIYNAFWDPYRPKKMLEINAKVRKPNESVLFQSQMPNVILIWIMMFTQKVICILNAVIFVIFQSLTVYAGHLGGHVGFATDGLIQRSSHILVRRLTLTSPSFTVWITC